MSESDLCERCGRDVTGTQHRAMCGHPLSPITDDELAGIRETYERGGVAALGFSQVARLLDKIDRQRDELREWQSAAENEWGYGDEPDDVDPIGDRNAARDCAQAYGAHVFVRSIHCGPWRKDD